MNEPAAADLERDLAAAGFCCLGGFSPGPADRVPALPDGEPPASLLLIGSTGPSIWPALVRSPEYRDGRPDPMDRYTRRVLSGIAERLGCVALFPFEGPPYHPFQQWALACGGFSRSPMGVLAHREFGPWAGFRAVFLSREPIAAGSAGDLPGPCETCTGKPCIPSCPAGALSLETGYDVPACRAHLASDRTADCWSGCLARRSCPIGTEHRPAPETAEFHMRSFIGLC